MPTGAALFAELVQPGFLGRLLASPAATVMLLLAAFAGGLIALAAREAVLASPAAASWLGRAIEPLRRAGREGYAPSAPERRCLAVLGALAAVATG